MAISLLDIKNKKKKIDEINTTVNPNVTVSNNTSPQQTISLADIRNGKITISPIVTEEDKEKITNAVNSTSNKINSSLNNVLNIVGNKQKENLVKMTEKNAKEKREKFEESRENYQKALSKEYEKRNVSFNNPFQEFNEKVTFENRDRKIQPNLANSTDVQNALKSVEEERQQTEKARFESNLADYQENVAKVENEDVNWWDKTGGNVVRGLADLGSFINPSDREYVDENGNKVYLPTYNELKQEKVSENYDTGIGKLLGDSAYNISKILGSTAINSVAPGVGTATYWGDMFTDSYTSAVNEGYDKGNALLYSTLSTGSEYLTGKFLGSATKGLTGGKTSELSKAISGVTSKLIKNPKIANIIGSAGSEATEEFIQEYIGNINRLAVLENSTNAKDYLDVFTDEDVLRDALYSAGVGAVSGGITNITDPTNRNVTNSTDVLNNFRNELEESRANTTDKTKIETFDKAIKLVDDYLTTSSSNEGQMNVGEQNQGNTNQINLQQTTANERNQQLQNQVNMFSLNQTNPSLEKVEFINSARKYNIKVDSDTIQSINRALSDRGVRAVFDDTKFNNSNINALWRINDDGTRDVIFNPNANTKDLMENVAVHELYHDIANQQGDNYLQNLVLDMASTKEGYLKARESLVSEYAKVYDINNPNFNNIVNEEAVATILGEKLGNQEFINLLTTERRSIAKVIYDSVISILNKLNKLTGYKSEKLYWTDVKNKFEKAYKNNNINIVGQKNGTERFSIQTDPAGNKFVNIDTDQDIFRGKSLYEQTKIAKQYILDKFKGKELELKNDSVSVTRKTANEYTHPRNTLQKKDASNKMKASTELDNLLSISKYEYSQKDDGRHPFAKDGWDYYSTKFVINGNEYTGLLNIAKNGNKKMLYDITKLKRNTLISSPVKNTATESIGIPFSENNISDFNQNVKSDTRYSMQQTENNAKGLDNSSFSFNETARRYNDLQQASRIDYIATSDGDINTIIYDKDGNLINQIILYDKNMANKEYGNQIGDYLFSNSSKKWQTININNNNGNISNNHKSQQLDIINNSNPMLDDYHTGIRTIDDIKTFREAYSEAKAEAKEGGWTEYASYPDITNDIVEEALNTNEITVYSSNDIKNGTFVTPSYEQALEYTGNDATKVKSKKVNLNDVAWINLDEGQYAKVAGFSISKEDNLEDRNSATSNNIKYSKESGNWQNFVEKNFKNEGTGKRLQDLKENNTLEIVSKSDVDNALEKFRDYREKNGMDNHAKELQKEYSRLQTRYKQQNNTSEKKASNKLARDPFKESTTDIVNNIVKSIENGKVNEQNVDEFIYDSDYYNKNHIDITDTNSKMTANEIDEYNRRLYDKIYDNIQDKLKKEGISRRYDSSHDENVYDTQELAKKGYNELLDYLDKNNVNYEISKSTNAGYVPSIYIKDSEGDTIFRIGNHNNGRISDHEEVYDDRYNHFFSDKEYANWQEYIIPKITEETGLFENNKNKSKTELNENKQEDVLTIKQDNNNVTNETSTKSKDDGESRFYRNITERSQFLTQENRDKLSKEDYIKHYDTVSNEESMSKALDRLNEGGEAELNRWFAKGTDNKAFSNLQTTWDSTDVAEGWILLKRAQDNGDYDMMVEVAKKMREIGTKSGQAVQMYNLLARLTPEGMVKYATSELDEAWKIASKNKSKEWVDKYAQDFQLTPDETEYIVNQMQKVEKMPDGRAKTVEIAKVQKMLQDKLPPIKGQGIKSWMRISMLLNPKTQVRNVMGNAVIAPVNAVADTFAAIADRQIAKKTGVRTTGNTSIKNYAKGFKKGLAESYEDFKLGVNTRNIQGNRFEIGEGKSFNENHKGVLSKPRNAISKGFNRLDSLLSFVLDAGDRGFYEASFVNSINNQMTLNKTSEVTQDMIDVATNEALSRTWQDNNNYTKFVLDIRRGMNKISAKGYGLGDVLIPFAKTPANLTKAIVDYSPVGLVKTLASDAVKLNNNIKTGTVTTEQQHKFVQNLGKATAGIMLYIAGMTLAQAGITSGTNDDDKDVSDFMKNTLGIQPYSIKIGNHTFTYDWAQPVAAPFAITADITRALNSDDVALKDAITTSLDSGFNILLEQSFLSGIQNVLNTSYGSTTENIIDEILGLPARAVPTFVKQINDMIDPKTRMTFEKGKQLESAKNQVKTKIPGLSDELPVKRDTLGREVEKYGGENNIFNIFFNPANISKGKVSESAKEIYEVYQSTKDKTIMPRSAPNDLSTTITNKKGEKKKKELSLDNKDKSEFLKISGGIINDNVKELKDNKYYKKLDDDEKALVIKEIVDYSYNKAKADLLDIDMSEVSGYKAVTKKLKGGMALYDYYAQKIYKNR